VTEPVRGEASRARVDFVVPAESAGGRLDVVLAETAGVPRAQARRSIDSGEILVGGHAGRASQRVRAGDRVTGWLPISTEEPSLAPEEMHLDIYFEDDHLVVVNKPAHLVVHPAPGHARGTLVNGLLFHCSTLSSVGSPLRPGVVHRLDKGTSGLLVSAKTDIAHEGLAIQFHDHTVDREYLAVVRGRPNADSGLIDKAIGRHGQDGKRFSTRARGRTRVARTRWSVRARSPEHALLSVRPETGRTHQIRVHLASVGLPIVGDPVYGGGRKHSLGLSRQALHATRLGFVHPVTRERVEFEAPLPDDLATLCGRVGL